MKISMKNFKHRFNPQTWVKLENRARKEGKTPEAVALLILSRRVGLMSTGAAR